MIIYVNAKTKKNYFMLRTISVKKKEYFLNK